MQRASGVFYTRVLFLLAAAALPYRSAAAPPPIVGQFVDSRAGNPQDFDVLGSLGCLVTKRGPGPELSVLDLQDPGNPKVLGGLDFRGRLNRVVLQDDVAYVATGLNDRELVVVDVANPAAPVVIGGYDTESSRDALSLAIRGSVLFLGTKRAASVTKHELYVIDVSNPAAPAPLASIDVGADVNDLALEGDVLYAATNDNHRELIAFDVSTPSAIAEINAADLPGSADAEGLDVHRGSIYVVRRTRKENFWVLDAASMSQISTLRLDGRGAQVRVYRDRAYVAMDRGSAGLQIVDIGDPSQPHPLEGVSNAAGSKVRVAGAHAYLTSRKRREGVIVVDTKSLMRPNVIMVYTDDQHLKSVDFMPELQALASRGLSFRQSFVTTPICGPSRASLLTGLYTHNHGVILNAKYIGFGPGAIGTDQSTIATWLQDAGYRTGFFGKYVNGFSHHCIDGLCYVPPGWDDWQGSVGQGIGHSFFGHGISNNGVLELFGSEPEDYSTDVLARRTLDFIETSDNRPFFAILSVSAPHLDDFLSLPPAPRHVGVFDGIPPWRPPSYDEEDLSDKLAEFQNRPRASDPFSITPSYGWWVDYVRQRQLEALLSVDEAIGDIEDALEQVGEYEDTVIIFTSDNGFYWGEHRLWTGKGGPEEESIRVPLTISYPRLIEPGREDDTHMALNIDLAPTIAELAGTVPGGPVDGRSLVPLLEGEVVPWRVDFLIEHYGSFVRTENHVYQGIRHASGVYAYYPNIGEDEIYDLLVDADEMESQASNPAYDPVRSYCQDRINQLMTNDALRVDFGTP